MSSLIIHTVARMLPSNRHLVAGSIILLIACPFFYATANYGLGFSQLANRFGISPDITAFEQYMGREFTLGMSQGEVHAKLERMGVSYVGGWENWAPQTRCEAVIFRFNALPTFGLLVFDNEYRYRFCYTAKEGEPNLFAYFFRPVS